MSCRSNDHLALEKGGGCGFLYSHRCTTRCVRWRGISPKVTSFHWPFAIYTDLNLSDLQESEARTIFSINLMDFDVGKMLKAQIRSEDRKGRKWARKCGEFFRMARLQGTSWRKSGRLPCFGSLAQKEVRRENLWESGIQYIHYLDYVSFFPVRYLLRYITETRQSIPEDKTR